MNKEGSRVICNPVCLKRCRDRVTYDSRPFLVHLVFADLSSLHPSSFHEMIFTLTFFYGRLRARTQCIRAIRACALKTTPILVCLKRLITPGLLSLEAFGFVRASAPSLHRSVYRRSNIMSCHHVMSSSHFKFL